MRRNTVQGTLSTGHCPRDTIHGTLSTGHSLRNIVHGTQSTGHCPRDTIYGTQSAGHSLRDTVHGTLSTGRCLRDTVHGTQSTGHCPRNTLYGTLSTPISVTFQHPPVEFSVHYFSFRDKFFVNHTHLITKNSSTNFSNHRHLQAKLCGPGNNFVLNSIVRGPEARSRYSDSIRTGLSGDRIPVEVRFFAPVQTGPRAQPTSCIMGTVSLSWG